MDTRASVIAPCFGIAATVVNKTVVDRRAHRPRVVVAAWTVACVETVSSADACRVAFAGAVAELAGVAWNNCLRRTVLEWSYNNGPMRYQAAETYSIRIELTETCSIDDNIMTGALVLEDV